MNGKEPVEEYSGNADTISDCLPCRRLALKLLPFSYLGEKLVLKDRINIRLLIERFSLHIYLSHHLTESKPYYNNLFFKSLGSA